jgi:hypothetical protein
MTLWQRTQEELKQAYERIGELEAQVAALTAENKVLQKAVVALRTAQEEGCR